MAVTDVAVTRGPRPRPRTAAAWLSWVLLPALAVAAMPAARAEAPAEQREADRVAHTRAVFDDAFVALRERLPPEAARAGHPLNGLHTLLEFRAQRVGWLLMGKTDYLVPRGKALKSWFTVVPRDHPYRRGMRSSLEMTAERDFFVVHVAEADYHPAWAMLFAVHELTHLYDRETGLEPLEPTRREFLDAEVRAYRYELQVAELLSDGDFVRGLDAMLDDWAPKDMRAVDLRANQLEDHEAERLSRAIDHAEARSPNEDGLRRGFFWIALVMRHADRTGAGDAAVREVLERRTPMSNSEAKVVK